MFTMPMVQLFTVVLDHDVDRVTDVLLQRGVMHFMNVSDVEERWSDKLHAVNPGVSLGKIIEMRKRVEGLLSPSSTQEMQGEKFGGFESQEFSRSFDEQDVKEREPLNLDEETKKLDTIVAQLEQLREKQRKVQQEIASYSEIKSQLEKYGAGLSERVAGAKYSFIDISIGRLPHTALEMFLKGVESLPSVVIPLHSDEAFDHLLLVTMKRDSARVEELLEKSGWEDIEFSRDAYDIRAGIGGNLDEKIARLRNEYIRLEDEKRKLIDGKRGDLVRLWKQLRISELFYKIQTYFRRTSRTVLFSGWVPSEKLFPLVEDIQATTRGHCYIEWHDPRSLSPKKLQELKPPVQLRNPRFLTPFQMLVTNYGIPEYGTIDPTPFVMVAYLIMFGLMFADVGQGLILMLLGVIGSMLIKVKKEGFRNLLKLIIWCGLASVVTGVLFGSYFGMEWIKPLWFDFHGIVLGNPHKKSFVNDIFDILTITIVFGIAVIGVGLLFNWINLFRKRKWIELILDRGGLVGGWLFAGGIYTAWYLVHHGYRSLPEPSILFYAVGLPALLLFIKHPLLFIVGSGRGHREPFNLFTPMRFMMEGVVELLEVFSGYLSNTLSFMRVAGLGIAHVSLMTAFFELARMTARGGGYNIWSILILIFGNILVIGLEGLSAGVQSLRLNYYEFFTKFFSGTGKLYSPVSLHSRV
jgi:V/A-type H+-transporting ATPase subunit I